MAPHQLSLCVTPTHVPLIDDHRDDISHNHRHRVDQDTVIHPHNLIVPMMPAEDWVFPVPERARETEVLLVIGDSGKTVLAPAVGARAGVIVGEEIPGVTPWAIVFPHGAPLTSAQSRVPIFPMPHAEAGLSRVTLFRLP